MIFRSSRRWVRWWPFAVASILALLAALIVRASWLRWMDPFVDFGRELYMPWRILAGEHPGRDFVHLYGPFSAYWNAGLFAVFGVAVRTLVLANLAVAAAILGTLFVVLRRAFGFVAATITCAVAIPVFGFPHYSGINNYTYAAPYSHEAIHGMLFLVCTLSWLGRAQTFRPGWRGPLVTGVGFGLCCLTKTEYVLVTFLLWPMVLARSAWAGTRRDLTRWAAFSIAGFAAVFALACALLATALPIGAAAKSAANAFLAPFSFHVLSHSPLGLKLLGADQLGANLLKLGLAGTAALVTLGGVVLVGRRWVSGDSRAAAWTFLVTLGALAVVGMVGLPWLGSATVFPAILAGGSTVLLVRRWAWLRRTRVVPEQLWNQLLLGVAAAGMLARMAFDPALNHYGFFQALLAGVWVMGFLLGPWPRFTSELRLVRIGVTVAVAALLAGGAAQLWARSLSFYRKKETPVGQGGDVVIGYRPDVYGLPQAWEQVRALIAARTDPTSTVLVVPEGISLNYWTRRKSPLPILDLLPATLVLNPGDVLAALKANPPDLVVFVSRDMTEFGYAAYGQDEASGQAIVTWVLGNYALEIQAGDPPFTPGRVGLWVLRRKKS